jgi:hypothetical protein
MAIGEQLWIAKYQTEPTISRNSGAHYGVDI